MNCAWLRLNEILASALSEHVGWAHKLYFRGRQMKPRCRTVHSSCRINQQRIRQWHENISKINQMPYGSHYPERNCWIRQLNQNRCRIRPDMAEFTVNISEGPQSYLRKISDCGGIPNKILNTRYLLECYHKVKYS